MDTRQRDGYRVNKNRSGSSKERPGGTVCKSHITQQNESQSTTGDGTPHDQSSSTNVPDTSGTQDEISEGDTSQIALHSRLVQTYGLLRILPKVEISTKSDLLVLNPDENGPQTDICARVPGRPGCWVARTSCHRSHNELWDLMANDSGHGLDSISRYFITGTSKTYEFDEKARQLVPSREVSVSIIVSPIQRDRLLEFGEIPPVPTEADVREMLGEEVLVEVTPPAPARRQSAQHQADGSEARHPQCLGGSAFLVTWYFLESGNPCERGPRGSEYQTSSRQSTGDRRMILGGEKDFEMHQAHLPTQAHVFQQGQHSQKTVPSPTPPSFRHHIWNLGRWNSSTPCWIVTAHLEESGWLQVFIRPASAGDQLPPVALLTRNQLRRGVTFAITPTNAVDTMLALQQLIFPNQRVRVREVSTPSSDVRTVVWVASSLVPAEQALPSITEGLPSIAEGQENDQENDQEIVQEIVQEIHQENEQENEQEDEQEDEQGYLEPRF
ncbi:hypothetical protein FGADI_3927 [Fusarium gaditjirri]|uniref:Uncharacterized protein n=1 Tax=Fusarium gaditjirri TaxID=282569 RepID=A0A8H4TE51_9HYPO|nr:hypothetical protein FGADI_3927 [Fusarium gaditjirri]